jgi:chromate reductase, NAD(P)H dehydrogenase (quinone)
MITIISGTNRVGSNTKKVAKLYEQVLQEMNVACNFIDLEFLKETIKTPEIIKLEQDVLIPTNKFIIITPEYNGSIPGIFKLFLDITDIRNVWWYKKICLTGVASGRAGNNRGMDNLTNIFNYLKANVYWQKLPLSQIETELTADATFAKPETLALVKTQLNGFLEF